MQLIHAARRGDWTMFEYLLERGASIPFDTQAIYVLLQRREDWIAVARFLAHQHHVPLAAVRTIHEFVVGFNWSAVCGPVSTVTAAADHT